MKKILLVLLIGLFIFHSCIIQKLWIFETVDDKPYTEKDMVCSFDNTAIAIDSTSTPHIIYVDVCNNQLKYAFRNSSGWVNEVVDSGVGIIQFSIAVDSSNNPHICYSETTTNTLKYAYKDGYGWDSEIIDKDDSGIMGPSISIDSIDKTHISYRVWHLTTDGKKILKYGSKDESGWHLESIDNASDVSDKYTKIVLDSTDMPHITYIDGSKNSLKYYYKNSTGWSLENEFVNSLDGSIKLDSEDKPHIIYIDSNEKEGKYAYKDSYGWHMESITGARFPVRIQIDSYNRPHIIAYNNNNEIEYGYRNVSEWTMEKITFDIWAADFALGANNIPHISCLAGENHIYKYAYREKAM